MKRLSWIALFLVIFVPATANAQSSSVNISVAPAIIEVAAEPGETIHRSLVLRSKDEKPRPVSLQTQSFLTNDQFIDFEKWRNFDAKTWIGLSDSNLILDGTNPAKIDVVINVPKTANPGGHYAQVSVRALSIEQSYNSLPTIALPEVAVTVFITVKGDIKKDLFVQSGNIFPEHARPGSEVKGKFWVVNDGNVHELVSPKVVLTTAGKFVAEFVVRPEVILPDTKREFEYSFTVPSHIAFHNAQIILEKDNPPDARGSQSEMFFISQSIWTIALEWFVILSVLYLIKYRRNIKSSINVLIGR